MNNEKWKREAKAYANDWFGLDTQPREGDRGLNAVDDVKELPVLGDLLVKVHKLRSHYKHRHVSRNTGPPSRVLSQG